MREVMKYSNIEQRTSRRKVTGFRNSPRSSLCFKSVLCRKRINVTAQVSATWPARTAKPADRTFRNIPEQTPARRPRVPAAWGHLQPRRERSGRRGTITGAGSGEQPAVSAASPPPAASSETVTRLLIGGDAPFGWRGQMAQRCFGKITSTRIRNTKNFGKTELRRTKMCVLQTKVY